LQHRFIRAKAAAHMLKTLQEWAQYREMFIGLVHREVRVRYRGSVLGVAWTLMNPLLQMLIYTLVFSTIMRTGIPEYGVFVFCGLLPWTWFSSSLAQGAASIVSNAGLIRKIYFPSEMLPVVAVAANLINFLLAFPILLGVLAWHGHYPTVAWLALPLVLAAQFLFTSVLVLLLAMLNTFFRDVSHLISVVMMLWFYLTPVLYPSSLIPPSIAQWMALNPMYPIAEAYRQIFMASAWPSLGGIGYTMLVGLLLFAVVFPVFARQKCRFAEYV
jgi:ABC-2 type transport system permease protein